MAHADVHDPLQAPAEPEAEADARETPNVVDGIIAGVVGGCVIALFFFGIDVAAGHALWTPTALGAAFFRGQPLPAGAPPVPALVAGYTVMHTAGFIAIGLIATSILQAFRQLPSPAPLAALVTGALFIAFQAYILTIGAILDPALVGRLGTGRVAAANALAAVAMGALLAWRAHQEPEVSERGTG